MNDSGKMEELVLAGRIAGNVARLKVLTALETNGVTVEKIAKTLKSLLNAGRQTAKYVEAVDEWKYSKKISDNSTRLSAVKLTLELLDAFPSQKYDITTDDIGLADIMDEIDSDGPPAPKDYGTE